MCQIEGKAFPCLERTPLIVYIVCNILFEKSGLFRYSNSMLGKVLKLISESLEGRKVYFLEADENLNWFGAPVKEVCDQLDFNDKNFSIVQTIKSNMKKLGKGEGWIVYIDPLNMFADIYEAEKPRYRDRWNKERPFNLSPTSIRIGFFSNRNEAYDIFLRISKKLKEENLKFDVIYT